MTRRLLLAHPAALGGENHGVYIQHVASMQWLLDGVAGWEVVAMDHLDPSFAEVALSRDLVIVHMLSGREIEPLIRLRRQRGLRTLVEMGDNFLDLGSWLPGKHALRSPLVRQSILYNASIADALQVYSRGLGELFRNVNPNVLLLDPYVPIRGRRGSSGSFVIGWGGTSSHAADLETIAPAIVEFCQRHRDATIAFMGDQWLFSRLFSAISPTQTRVQPFSRYETYLDFVEGFDVGLAPLGRSGFNAARTDTKFATYAACGVAALLAEHEVYKPFSSEAAFFASPVEFARELESLYADRPRLTLLAERAHQWARRERSAEKLRAQRLNGYEAMLPDRPVEQVELSSDREAGRRLGRLVGSDAETALGDLEQIVSQYPRYTQARLSLVRRYEKRGDFAAAYELLDGAPHAAIYNDVVAETLANLAREVAPSEVSRHTSRIESPVARARLDYRGDQKAYLAAMLRLQPYDYLALVSTIRDLVTRDPASPELANLCLRASLIAPEIVPEQYRVSDLARFLPS
jgi:hypothetical protein